MDKKLTAAMEVIWGVLKISVGFYHTQQRVCLSCKLPLSLTGQVHGNVKKVTSHIPLPLRDTSKETPLHLRELRVHGPGASERGTGHSAPRGAP